MSEEKESLSEKIAKRWEIIVALTLAIFATMFGLNDLASGRYGDDEQIAHKEHISSLNWYQSKSMKQIMVQSRIDLINSMVALVPSNDKNREYTDKLVKELESEVARYKKEKKEIEEGSANVGKENWVLEVNGQKGNYVGYKEWEERANKLGEVGDVFDTASLFLNICLVFGAMGVVVQLVSLRKFFLVSMILLGTVGTFYAVKAYLIASAI